MEWIKIEPGCEMPVEFKDVPVRFTPWDFLVPAYWDGSVWKIRDLTDNCPDYELPCDQALITHWLRIVPPAH